MLIILSQKISILVKCIIEVAGGVERGGGGRPNDKKSCCSRNAQICNKIDALAGSSEMASATALFYLEKGGPLYPKKCFPAI